MYNSIEGH